MDLLWTNENMLDSFSPKEIALDLSKYNCIGILLYPYSEVNYGSLQIVLKNTLLQIITVMEKDSGYVHGRGVVCDDGKVTFNNGYNGYSHSIDDHAGIPGKIYGIR